MLSPRPLSPLPASKTAKHLASMNIIKEKWLFLNSTSVYVSPQLSKLYSFGLATLAARPVESLRSNARILSLNWNTAKSKACRLVGNERFLRTFPRILAALKLVSPEDTICVDFSDFGDGF